MSDLKETRGPLSEEEFRRNYFQAPPEEDGVRPIIDGRYPSMTLDDLVQVAPLELVEGPIATDDPESARAKCHILDARGRQVCVGSVDDSVDVCLALVAAVNACARLERNILGLERMTRQAGERAFELELRRELPMYRMNADGSVEIVPASEHVEKAVQLGKENAELKAALEKASGTIAMLWKLSENEAFKCDYCGGLFDIADKMVGRCKDDQVCPACEDAIPQHEKRYG